MKSVDFQRNKSLIRVVNEKSNKPKKRNIDKIVYLILLCAVVFFGVYYLCIKNLFVTAQGQVLIDVINIRLTEDARILKHFVAEGDSVKTGDTLFCYANSLKNDLENSENGINLKSYNAQDNWALKEIYNLKKKIVLNKIDISKNYTVIKSYEAEIKNLTNQVILDALPRTRLDFVQNELLRLNAENTKLFIENKELENFMKNLPSGSKLTMNSFRDGRDGGGGYVSNNGVTYNIYSDEYLSELKYFKTPMDGIITRIHRKEQEVNLKSEDVMSVHKQHPTTIKGFFYQEDLQHIRIGDEFTIEFPDGSKSKGYVKRFYIATYNMPDEFQKKYEPTTRTIAVDIYPFNEEDSKKWYAFHKMGVVVSKFIFN
ncbi:MAG: hypothetical protein K0S32_1649 [Bacteroidetes bacterium]|jgi:multidrug resistance efflux pump|nr:hypothetical protein [Bacteroidota bacterium]